MARVVITGMGTFNPLGNDVETTWRAVAAGRSGVGPITAFDAAGLKTRIAGEVKDFDPEALFGRKGARRMSRVSQLAAAAATQALQHGRFSPEAFDRDRIGVIVGSGMGSLQPVIEGVRTLDERGPDRVSPFFVPLMLADSPAAQISIHHGLRGPNMAVVTACATGNDALGQAALLIRRGDADAMLAGGAEACLTPLVLAAFGNIGGTSTRNEAPQTAVRPFDRERDGFVPAEGTAVLLLESLAHARERGAAIYGELLGYGASADAYHISMPAPDGAGAVLAMRRALADAGLAPAQIDYINAHGTGTALNDKSETAAIKTVFGAAATGIPVSSTKSMHGHLLGAAGALEAVICLQAMRHGLIPPTINYRHPDPECDLDYAPNQARPAALARVMSNGFGLGGHNAALILGRWREDSV